MSVEVSKTSWAEIIALSYIYSNEKSKYTTSNKLHNTLAKWQSSTPLTCLSVDTQVANILIHLPNKWQLGRTLFGQHISCRSFLCYLPVGLDNVTQHT